MSVWFRSFLQQLYFCSNFIFTGYTFSTLPIAVGISYWRVLLAIWPAQLVKPTYISVLQALRHTCAKHSYYNCIVSLILLLLVWSFWKQYYYYWKFIEFKIFHPTKRFKVLVLYIIKHNWQWLIGCTNRKSWRLMHKYGYLLVHDRNCVQSYDDWSYRTHWQ